MKCCSAEVVLPDLLLIQLAFEWLVDSWLMQLLVVITVLCTAAWYTFTIVHI